MNRKVLAFVSVVSVSATSAFAGTCSYQFSDIQNLVRGPLTSTAQDASQRASALTRAASDLQRAIQSGGSAPNFEQSVNGQLGQASTEATHTREALYNANTLLKNDFTQAYNRAMAMVCEGGHCSPGITDALNQMRDIVGNANNNVALADGHAQSAISSIDQGTSTVSRAQQIVNQGTTNTAAIGLAQQVGQIASDLSRETSDLLGSSWGASGSASLNTLSNQLNGFSAQGCVNFNQ